MGWGVHRHSLAPLVWGRSLLVGQLLPFLLSQPAGSCPSQPSAALSPFSVWGLHGLGRPGPGFPSHPCGSMARRIVSGTPDPPALSQRHQLAPLALSIEEPAWKHSPGGNREMEGGGQSLPAARPKDGLEGHHLPGMPACPGDPSAPLWVAPAGSGECRGLLT